MGHGRGGCLLSALLLTGAYFDQFWTLATERDVQRALVLMGPRRVGKTVLLYHFVERLLQQGTNPKRILFITIENPIYNHTGLESLFHSGCEAAGAKGEWNGWVVIFDEIQYLLDWDIHLKSLMESYRDTKFIVSGSAAAALHYKSKESGACGLPISGYRPLPSMNLLRCKTWTT